MDSNAGNKIRLTTVPVYKRIAPEVPPLHLSPSSVIVFRQCRQRYKFSYIDKLGDVFGRPRPYFTMANHVHSTLKDFMSLKPALRSPAVMESLLQQNWQRNRTGFRDEKEEQVWMERALSQLRRFIASYDMTAKPVMVEKYLEVEVTAGLVLSGRIDRVDRESDGGLHIIDYKTGNIPDQIDWTQLELAALMVADKFPKARVNKISYLYLKEQATETASLSSERLGEIRWSLLSLADKVRREKKFLPSPGWWCGNCDFISICPARAEAEPFSTTSCQLELWEHIGEESRL
jgi:putative RecB family exonuclease